MSEVKDKFVQISSHESGGTDAAEALTELGVRLGFLIDMIGLDKAAEIAGKSGKQMKRYTAGAEPPFSVLDALVRESGATFDWLASGRPRSEVDHQLAIRFGNRTLDDIRKELRTNLSKGDRDDLLELAEIHRQLIAASESIIEKSTPHAPPSPTDLDQPGMIAIPRYDEVRPSAGHGSVSINEIPTTRVAFEQRWLTDIGVSPKDAVILPAQGDSMSPTIPNGAPMLVDTSKREVRNGFIYVFNIDGDLVVKRIERLPDGTFDLISDNRNYPTRNLSRNTVTSMMVIGRVYAAVSKF